MRAQRERGYAMVVALLVITLLLAGGALLAQELVTRAALLRSETNELHLQNVLDSAVSQMMAKYRDEPDFAGDDQLAIDGGKAKMRAQRRGVDQRRADITANYKGLKRRAVVYFEVKSGHPVRLIDYRFLPLDAPAYGGS